MSEFIHPKEFDYPLKNVWYETNFDPFFFANTTPRYKKVPDGVTEEQLIDIAKTAWNIDVDTILQVDTAAETGNFRLRDASGRLFLLKRTNTTPEREKSILSIMDGIRNANVPIPTVVPIAEDESFFAGSSGIYTLQEFISGRYYNGSFQDLTTMAKTMGKLDTLFRENAVLDQIQPPLPPELPLHPREKLQEIIDFVDSSPPHDSFDFFFFPHLVLLERMSEAVSEMPLQSLPQQLIYTDPHPQNVLFYRQDGDLAAVIDWDDVRPSQRIRPIAQALHRFGRGYGPRVEGKKDSGTRFIHRAAHFLDVFQENTDTPLSKEEIELFPVILLDEALRRVIRTAHMHYIERERKYDFGIRLQMSTFVDAASIWRYNRSMHLLTTLGI